MRVCVYRPVWCSIFARGTKSRPGPSSPFPPFGCRSEKEGKAGYRPLPRQTHIPTSVWTTATPLRQAPPSPSRARARATRARSPRSPPAPSRPTPTPGSRPPCARPATSPTAWRAASRPGSPPQDAASFSRPSTSSVGPFAASAAGSVAAAAVGGRHRPHRRPRGHDERAPRGLPGVRDARGRGCSAGARRAPTGPASFAGCTPPRPAPPCSPAAASARSTVWSSTWIGGLPDRRRRRKRGRVRWGVVVGAGASTSFGIWCGNLRSVNRGVRGISEAHIHLGPKLLGYVSWTVSISGAYYYLC